MDQSKVFSQRERAYPKGGEIPWYSLKEKEHIPKGEKYLSESSHEGEVARLGEEQRGKSWF